MTPFLFLSVSNNIYKEKLQQNDGFINDTYGIFIWLFIAVYSTLDALDYTSIFVATNITK